MKENYDFSQGERGKFYHPDAEFHLPVYLEPTVAQFIQQVALKRNTTLGELVNTLLKKDIELIESVK
jgi:ABC-type molybdate transport system permease subunit